MKDYNMLKSKIENAMQFLVAITPLLIVFAIVASIFVYSIGYINSKKQVEFVVTEKERVVHGETSRYLVWSNNETFEITDSYLLLRFDSSEAYGRLLVGERYCGVVAGWRYQFLSWYRNIISIHAC